MNDYIFFASVAFSLAGQFLDSYTTEVALAHGWQESVKTAKWMISKIGISGFIVLKCVGLAIVGPMLTLIAGSETVAAILAGTVGAVGFYAGIKNYLALKKAKISL